MQSKEYKAAAAIDPARADARKQYKLLSRLRRYGLTLDTYSAMRFAQGERCAICRDPLDDAAKPAVDHDHATGAVRGILCMNCNFAIGHLKDSPLRADKLAAYLRKHAPTLKLA
jgi:hypothetical protein